MEKFGVFKLLNSFFELYNKNNSQSNDSVNNAGGNSGNDYGGNNIKLGDLLFSVLNKNNSGKTLKPAPVNKPIFNPLLSAMQTHDKTVEKILKKEK